jgi:serine protease AprX
LVPAVLFLFAFALPAATSAKRGPEPGHPHPKVEHAPPRDDDEDEGVHEGKGEDKADDEGDESDEAGQPEHGQSSDEEPAEAETPDPAQPETGEAVVPPVVVDPAPAVETPAADDKIDPVLAQVVQDVANVDPDTPLRVLVYGSDATGAAASVGGDVRRELDGALTSVSVAAGSIAELVAQSGVGYVMLDVPVRPTAEADPVVSFGASFSVLDGAVDAWARGRTGRDVGVAVLDSGIGAEHAFGTRLTHVDLGQGARPDVHGHGTFVAGVLAGATNDGSYTGVAPGARIFDVNVSQEDGVYTSDVLAGIEWVLANERRLNIRVVNLSLAETLPSSYRTSPLDAAVERLWRRGIVVVAAAGNLGPGRALYAPANDPYVISVGALDQGLTLDRSDDVAAAFSATGPTPDGFSKPDLLAPGRRIVSLLPATTTLGRQAPAANVVAPGLAYMSGTSFAAPQVAGAAAVLLEQHPRWTPDQVKWVLTRTVRPVTGSTAGTLDLRRALDFRGRAGSANLAIRPAAGKGRTAPDGGQYTSSTWTSSTWTSSTWTSSTWTSSTWTSNTWTSALIDWFAS